MINELEEIRKERSYSNFRHYTNNFMQELRKTTKNRTLCLGHDSSQTPPEYKSEPSPLKPTTSVRVNAGKGQTFLLSRTFPELAFDAGYLKQGQR
jgi:hypothetical protein